MTRRLSAITAAFGALALAAPASSAPNVANVTQKGSLLVFPLVAVEPQGSTLVRLQNDGASDVDVKCYWLEWNKHRVDFIIPLTRNQAVWFDASTGNGTLQVNPFPRTAANGFTAGNRHPFSQTADGFSPSGIGMLACWAIDGAAQNQVKWNHLSGTATMYRPDLAFEYSAYAFAVPTGTDLTPVGTTPGTLPLNGLVYDACPLYQIDQLSPGGAATPGGIDTGSSYLFMTSCTLNLNQDWAPVWTKWQFDVWNEDEVKFTGAYECADSWHGTDLREGSIQRTDTGVAPVGVVSYAFLDGLDAGAQNFASQTLGTYAARYRVQGVKSPQCDRTKPASGPGSSVAAVTTEAVGLLGVRLSEKVSANPSYFGTTLTGAGKMNGAIKWDPEGAVPEGGIR